MGRYRYLWRAGMGFAAGSLYGWWWSTGWTLHMALLWMIGFSAANLALDVLCVLLDVPIDPAR